MHDDIRPTTAAPRRIDPAPERYVADALDGGLRVEVDARGRLLGITLAPSLTRVARDGTRPERIGPAIVDALARARADVRRTVPPPGPPPSPPTPGPRPAPDPSPRATGARARVPDDDAGPPATWLVGGTPRRPSR